MDLIDAARSLIAEAEAMTNKSPSPSLRAATGAFLDALARGGDSAPPLVFDALESLPPLGAAWLAITFGSAVEGGFSPALSVDPIVALLRRWLDPLPIEDDPSDEIDDVQLAPDIVAALPWVGQSLVAHLARFPARRAELAEDRSLLARLDTASAQSHGALWIHELLRRRSGSLVVVHVESRRGLALRYENVGSCFHLFTLVQGAIGPRLPGGRAPDLELIDAAMGGEHTANSDAAWWHYQDHSASEASFMNSLWAEWSVGDIPEIDGVRVLVLWPPIVGSRCWDAGFFGPALAAASPRVVVERELERAEVDGWFARIGVQTG